MSDMVLHDKKYVYDNLFQTQYKDTKLISLYKI